MHSLLKRYQVKLSAVFLLTTIWCHDAQAMPEYWNWWQEEYSAVSTSGESVCQLCHKGGGGGDGWNPYGWDVRSVANQDFSETNLKSTLRTIEDFLSDKGNASSNTYLEEILANVQPGWREGVVNLIKYSGGNPPDETIAPPEGLCGTVDPGSEPLPCAINDPQPSSIPEGNILLRLETIASGFTAPVLAVSAPGETEFIYVVEQGGKIQRVNLTTGAKELFLDLSALVLDKFGTEFGGYDERGLLGLAFHPDYATNNKIYTYISKNYVADAEHFSTMPIGVNPDHQAVISEWLVINPQSSPAVAINEVELLIIDEPQFNHNGGTVEFGPDGYLYIAFGDGGCADDKADEGCNPLGGHGADGNGRDNTNPLGAILRLDVDTIAPPNGRYGIPATNPFVGVTGLDEIYLFGFRNPYRFSFEELSNDEFNLYVGDVGQNAIEEVDRVHSMAAGGNYGWNYKEGSFYFYSNENGTYVSDLPPPGVTLPPLVDPIAEYDHDEGLSVIGGHVYTGTAIKALQSKYVFADWGRSFSVPGGRLFYLDENDVMHEFKYQSQPNMYITGFGKDSQNELYVVGSQSIQVNSQSGELKKLVLGSDEFCLPIITTNGKIAVICL